MPTITEFTFLKKENKLMGKIKTFIWHALIIVITFGSLAEVIIGFLPIESVNGTVSKLFFMGITLIGFFYEIINHLISSYFNKYNLEDMVRNGLLLSEQNRVESAVLYDIESNLDHSFGVLNGSYHIIIVTACFNPNERPYIHAIWENINNDVKYLYITPDNDKFFINSFINMFLQNGIETDIVAVYQKVVHNIFHLSRPEIFEILPENFDLCVYCKDRNEKINIDGALGFWCFQNEKIEIEKRTYFFYYRLGEREIRRIFGSYAREFDTEKMLQPYISSKIEEKNSPIDGRGLFCKAGESFKQNEVVMIKGGYELHKNQMAFSKVIDSYLPISDDLFLAAKTENEEKDVKLCINHSCNPNVGMLNERTFVAIRAISGGEELTIDYAFVDNEEYSFTCKCGASNCRGQITGYDWEKSDLQKKYFEYFSPYLQHKIKKAKVRKR